MQLYKITGPEGEACHGGRGSWFLPEGKRPGRWMPAIEGDIEPCENGYHLCRERNLVHWLGPVIWEAEHRGEFVEAEDKVVVRQARLVRRCGGWTEKTARLYAADCAERVLPIFEKEHPSDDRPRKAIEVARAFARGEIDDAARAAAWAAARAAASDAARDAAWAAASDAAWALLGPLLGPLPRTLLGTLPRTLLGTLPGPLPRTLPRTLPGPLLGPLLGPLPGTLLGTLPGPLLGALPGPLPGTLLGTLSVSGSISAYSTISLDVREFDTGPALQAKPRALQEVRQMTAEELRAVNSRILVLENKNVWDKGDIGLGRVHIQFRQTGERDAVLQDYRIQRRSFSRRARLVVSPERQTTWKVDASGRGQYRALRKRLSPLP